MAKLNETRLARQTKRSDEIAMLKRQLQNQSQLLRLVTTALEMYGLIMTTKSPDGGMKFEIIPNIPKVLPQIPDNWKEEQKDKIVPK